MSNRLWSRLVPSWILGSCVALLSCSTGTEPPGGSASVSVTPSNALLAAVGDTVRLSATARDAGGSVMSDAVFAWSSSQENVASVSSSGLVTAAAAGDVTITATISGGESSASAAVQVAFSTGGLRLITTTAGVNLDPDGYTVALGGTAPQAIAVNDTITINGLNPGPESVTLSGFVANCYPFSSQPISATVVAGTTTNVLLGVECLGIPDDVSLTFVRFEQVPPFTNFIGGLRAGSGAAEYLTFNPALDRAPDWSPDGTRLAFSRDDVIFVVNADGTGLRSFGIPGGTNPAWSPDGTKVAYDNGGSVLVFDPDGSGGVTVVTLGIQPAWSPDGSKITSEVDVGPSESDIFVVNVDGSGRRNLTNRIQLVDREPTWSPDGSQIAFRRLDRTESVGYDLWVMDADGTNQTRLVSIPGAQLNPRWLPDNRILFDSGSQIMALDVGAGGTVTALTSEPGFIHFQNAWRP